MLVALTTTAGQQEANHGKRQETSTKGSGKTSFQDCNIRTFFIELKCISKSYYAKSIGRR
jgi:hypothetical protein